MGPHGSNEDKEGTPPPPPADRARDLGRVSHKSCQQSNSHRLLPALFPAPGLAHQLTMGEDPGGWLADGVRQAHRCGSCSSLIYKAGLPVPAPGWREEAWQVLCQPCWAVPAAEGGQDGGRVQDSPACP